MKKRHLFYHSINNTGSKINDSINNKIIKMYYSFFLISKNTLQIFVSKLDISPTQLKEQLQYLFVETMTK